MNNKIDQVTADQICECGHSKADHSIYNGLGGVEMCCMAERECECFEFIAAPADPDPLTCVHGVYLRGGCGECEKALSEPCSTCNGSGTEADYVGLDMRCVEVECSRCNGKGVIANPEPPVPVYAGEGNIEYISADEFYGSKPISSPEGVELPPLSRKALINDGYDCRLAYEERTASLLTALAENRKLKELLDDAISMVSSGFHKRRLNLKRIQLMDKAAVTGE